MNLSRNDHIEPKVIENGVIVPPGLQVGVMTLKEHQEYLIWQKMMKPMTRREAIAAGHRPKEVYEYFGPLDEKETTVVVVPTLELVANKPAEPMVTMIMTASQAKRIGQAALAADDAFAESRARGYTGDSCPGCGMFTMVNNGTCLVCVGCGHTTGCS